MYLESGKVLAPVFFLVFASVLFGLLAAQPPTSSPPSKPEALAPIELPWAPFRDPGPALLQVSTLLSSTPRNEKSARLEELSNDPSRSLRTRGLAAFALGVHQLERKRIAPAVASFRRPEIDATELDGFALFYVARELETSKPGEALTALAALESSHPDFPLMDEVRLRYARVLRATGEREEAIRKLGPVTQSADDAARGDAIDELSKLFIGLSRHQDAVDVLETLYYELPRHKRANNGGRRLTGLRSKVPEVEPARYYELGMKRAGIFMEQGRYRDAYNGYASLLQRYREVADVDLVRLRMAISEYRRRRLTASVANFKRVTSDELEPEALYYRAQVARRLRRRKTQCARVSELETRFPRSKWTASALMRLADHHASNDEPDEALARFNQVIKQFPQGEHRLDARWHVHWNAYRGGRFEEAGRGFEDTARERPWAGGLARLLYWAGRSYQQAGELERADALYRQVMLGYQNSYYGRRALEHLSEMQGRRSSIATIEEARKGVDLSGAMSVQRVERQQRIAELLAVGLPQRALEDAEAAVDGERPEWDDAAFLMMAAWIHYSEGRPLQTIITIREAFPFHVSATGDLLPRAVWKLFYPLPYREHVEHYAKARGLDPFLVAALIRQESTFNPRVRSRAGARGLMQLIPATGRQVARQERRRYSTRELYNPEINIRYGTRYLKDMLARFNGRMDYALASYNAGPHRVKRWTGMDMSIDPEVFIEEIPFDETRRYVKLVLRNEMLYRRLYGGAGVAAAAAP